jgi:hypothetical protein
MKLYKFYTIIVLSLFSAIVSAQTKTTTPSKTNPTAAKTSPAASKT